jgi:hypothetical protein
VREAGVVKRKRKRRRYGERGPRKRVELDGGSRDEGVGQGDAEDTGCKGEGTEEGVSVHDGSGSSPVERQLGETFEEDSEFGLPVGDGQDVNGGSEGEEENSGQNDARTDHEDGKTEVRPVEDRSGASQEEGQFDKAPEEDF